MTRPKTGADPLVGCGRAAPLTDAELAFGIALGNDPSVPRIPRRDPPLEPLDAFEAALLPALARPPCLVSFSGGRDSSALLAVACRAAHRHGLPLPVPATLCFPGVAAADEEAWQRPVLEHLALDEWVRISIEGDELDAIGPSATAGLGRFGLLWPFNTHFHAPIVARAAGGSVVTGFGGDELARCSTTTRAEQVLAGRVRPRPRDALAVGLALSPFPARAAVHRRRARRLLARLPWLTEHGRAATARALGTSDAAVPFGWQRVLRTAFARGRYFRLCRHSFDLLGSVVDVTVFHPFIDPIVLDALASAGGLAGLGDRTAMVQRLFGTLLPDRTVARPTKGLFTDPLWTETARRFAARWSGGGVDANWIDVEALRRHWASDRVDVRSTTLLQAAWLHDAGSSATGAEP